MEEESQEGTDFQWDKVAVVLTSRGNYAKFKKLLELRKPKLIVGGEFPLQDRVTGLFDLKPDFSVWFNVAGDNGIAMGKSVGAAVSEFCTAYAALKVEYVFLVGDRFETLAAAVAAHMMRVRIIHLEGGEVSGTLDNGNRYAISALASVHFTCTSEATLRLDRMGYEPVINVGATSLDAMLDMVSEEEANKALVRTGVGMYIDVTLPYDLVIYHPDTYLGNMDFGNLLDDVAGSLRAVLWIGSNLDAGSELLGHVIRQRKKNFAHVRFVKSFPIEYYARFLKNAVRVLGNSSSFVREANFFEKESVIYGERQTGRNEQDYGDGHATERMIAWLETVL